MTIESKLEEASKDLLDLSYRNRMLNFRVLKSKGVSIVEELSTAVLDILYNQQKSMSFDPIPGGQESGEETDQQDLFEKYLQEHKEAMASEEEGESRDQYYDNKLQTKYVDEVLERRLLNTYYAAKTSIEESGVNILFISLGMLHWYDPQDPERKLKAPVVLLPVSLERKNVKSKFMVTHNGDELGENISLIAKLKNDFGIQWPSFDSLNDEDDFDLRTYFEKCREIVEQQKNWVLEENEMHLGFFSFHKYAMYKDLDTSLWPEGCGILDNNIIQSLLGQDGFYHEEPVIPNNVNLDEFIDKREVYHVMDSDSSQFEALMEVADGKNMIIQGPPGTGKSQTITNIIAQAVATGKTVLFVAEKMAALEVVKRRMNNIDLGDVVLELHSSKTNKKEFLERLEDVWSKGRARNRGFDDNLNQLVANMEEANRHAKEVNEPINNSGRSLYFFYGRLMALRKPLSSIKPPSLDIEDWQDWTGQQFKDACDIAKKLEILIGEVGVLSEHPFRDVTELTAVMPGDVEEIGQQSGFVLTALKEVEAVAEPIKAIIGIHEDLNIGELECLANAITRLRGYPDLAGLPTDNHAWIQEKGNIFEVLAEAEEIKELVEKYNDDLTEEAWGNKDAKALMECLQGYSQNCFRWFCPKYRAASKKASQFWRIRPPFKLRKRLDALDAIVSVQAGRKKLAENDEALSHLFASCWHGDQSDFRLLREITSSLYELHSLDLPEDTLLALTRFAAVSSSANTPADRIDALQNKLKEYIKASDALLERLKLNKQLDSEDKRFRDYPISLQKWFLTQWNTSPESLIAVSKLNSMREEIVEKNVMPLWDVARSWESANRHLADLLEYRWCEFMIKEYFRSHPKINQFSPGLAERWVNQFAKADQDMLLHNRARVLQAHYDCLPPKNGSGEMGILNHEFAKRARHKPVRKLIKEAGLAIQKAKPVFMMSPFSVATYLPRGKLEFDLVVFDEASQVRPVDAFGSIARGKQVIVVGDSKQLPPSSFFDKLQTDDDLDESPTRDLESILKQFESKGAFSKMLRWHYRSRHNSLIDYSNYGFYKNRLTVFPSPDNKRDSSGLSFVHVPEGVYERGRGRRRNPGEAKRIAAEVMKHAENRPDLSLGVVSFSMSQMQEIQDRIEISRRQNPETESFFSSHPDEPFFVKNLENVQGDERDVMMISVGYGKDKAGNLSMNFGPLNNDGGERRLNVLITRAKDRCVIFSNIKSDDIDLRRTNAVGVRHLKGYLKYAETGLLDTAEPTGREPDSPFEIEVANSIRSLGYRVDHQVGSSGYFIDLAVVDPDKPGRYLLGVECDGATYHSARWARDRDRLRQQVLEDLGWKIHRIWSTSWFREEDKELQKLHEAINRAEIQTPLDTCEHAEPKESTKLEREKHSLDKKPVQAMPYRMARLDFKKNITDFNDLDEFALSNAVQKVVDTESPVHVEELMRRILSATDVNRLGRRIRDRMEYALMHLDKQGKINICARIAWSTKSDEVLVRDRSSVDATHKVELIPKAEIEKALVQIVRESCSIEKNNLFRELLGLLGLGALTKSRKEYLNKLLLSAVKKGLLIEKEGRYMISEKVV